ncbi:hypothetical protein [Bryobacter aggregatus]|uniref:hypothetical protein n=1 Tax=Bryobacter aggregatus TaxID=360054 RepID=UPI0004E1954C|nr:hypothetical protein [Bryobacter aggregatus]
MRLTAILLLASAAALGVFSYWGLFTTSGRQRFDEMSGMIPFFAGCLAALAAVSSGIAYLIAWRRG